MRWLKLIRRKLGSKWRRYGLFPLTCYFGQLPDDVGVYICPPFGQVPEWLNGTVSKTVEPVSGSVSSNLTLSATSP